MRIIRALPLVVAALGFVACGSSSTKKNPDAAGSGSGIDAANNTPDAPPAGLQGLGQKCTTPADCPTSAPECITLKQNGTHYCTPHCLDNGTGTTNGSGQFVGSGTGALTPLPDDTKCTAVYTGGTAGSAFCEVILAVTPADNPLKANTKYTGVVFGCAIECGTGNTCPTGTTCDTTQGICYPN
jgi:hypothetical protein